MQIKILFTGLPGCGKTTLIKKIISEYKGNATGFFTNEMREKGKRCGFSIQTLDGKQGIMTHVNISSQYRIGKYGVNAVSLRK
jgi:nucleoside-triphosphatase